MDKEKGLRRNPRLLFWAKAFTEVKALNAFVTLFYLHRGVSIDGIFYLTVVWSVTSLILEVPTGYLADRVGRKKTLLLGAIVLLLSQLATWFAQGTEAFILVAILMSASFALFSGTTEAMLFESLKATGREEQMTKHNGRLHAAHHLFKIIIPTIGAFIAKDLTEPQFFLVIALDVIASLFALLLLFFLTEPRHTQEVLTHEKDVFRSSLQLIRREPLLFRAAMNKALIFIASFVTWRIYQIDLSSVGVPVVWLAVFYFLLHVGAFSFQWFSERMERRLGTPRILFWTAILTTGCLLVLIQTRHPIILFLFYLFALIIPTARDPLFAHAMNRLIASHHRATTLSNLNVLKSILDIPILFLSSYLVLSGLTNVIWLAIIVSTIAILFFPLRRQDFTAVEAAT